MTDDEFAKADAEWRALPGTPPDGWSFISRADLQERGRAAMDERLAKWRVDGMNHYRATDCADDEFGDGVWIEVWTLRPNKEAAFNPPMTVSPA